MRISNRRERRSHAEVRAEPERDVIIGLTGHVEVFRFDEMGLVAVGRAVHEHNLITRPNGLAGDLGRFDRDATHVVNRASRNE